MIFFREITRLRNEVETLKGEKTYVRHQTLMVVQELPSGPAVIKELRGKLKKIIKN